MRRSPGPVPARLVILICALALGTAVVGLTAQASGTTERATAKAARRVHLIESAHLKLIKEEGATLTERGQAVGTYNAPVTATFTIRPKSVTAIVTIYPKGGSITGTAHANYVVQNSVGYFGGTLTLGRGTGSFRHLSEVKGMPLGVSGTINRYSFAIEVKAHGEANS
jgi:hypothetical protein